MRPAFKFKVQKLAGLRSESESEVTQWHSGTLHMTTRLVIGAESDTGSGIIGRPARAEACSCQRPPRVTGYYM
jgi:hypothetical protein